jgi:hypothetical protein
MENNMLNLRPRNDMKSTLENAVNKDLRAEIHRKLLESLRPVNFQIINGIINRLSRAETR